METNINMSVKDLKDILKELPDEMPVVIPVISEDDCNQIFGFRHVRTAGVLHDPYDPEEPRALAINAAANGADISSQVKNRDVICEKILF